MAKIVHVVGARPNYMKVAPLFDAMRRAMPSVTQILVDTGQHYDDAVAGAFVRDLALPAPHWNLGVGSGSRHTHITKVAAAFEQVCRDERPDVVVVVGDVNSTLGAATGAARVGVPVAHVEAGLRSFDPSMPEEENRMLTDRLAHFLFTPSLDANDHLAREGVPADRIHFVGNVMIDTLLRYLPEARFDRVSTRFGIRERGYAVCTLHRPDNVDRRETFTAILNALRQIAEATPVVFPIHPRTQCHLQKFGLDQYLDGIRVCGPLGYLDFLALTSHARALITDSGGLQEEGAFLGIPCITVRRTTERPITLMATNRLAAPETSAILAGYETALAAVSTPLRPDLWDGRTAERIVAVLCRSLPA